MPFRNHVKIGTSKHKFVNHFVNSFVSYVYTVFIYICIYIYIISHTDIKEGLQSPASKCFFHFTISFTIGPCIFGEVDIN